MRMPTQSRPADRSDSAQAHLAAWKEAGVSPQQQVCTPCVQIGGGRWCVNLPIFGRRCFTVPSVGRWRACCRFRLGIPPISCGISRC
jgi:hypothetical protein